MNLSSIKNAVETVTSVEQGVILHEWGHVLGLYHEHQVCSLYIHCLKFCLSILSPLAPREQDCVEKEGDHWILSYNFSRSLAKWPQDLGWHKYIQYSVAVELWQIWSRIDYDVSSNLPQNLFQLTEYAWCRYNIPRCCYMVRYGEQGVLPPNQNTELSASDMAYMAVNYPKPCPVGVSPSSTPVQLALRNLNIPSDVCEDWDHSNVRDKFWKYVSENWSMLIPFFLYNLWCNW